MQWPVLIVFLMTVIAVLYRYAPDREAPQWQWASPGAATATVLWVVGSILFSVYVTHIGDYNATYGALGGMVVLLTWLYLSAFVVVLGAEINAEMERQTRVDTTTGRSRTDGASWRFCGGHAGPVARFRLACTTSKVENHCGQGTNRDPTWREFAKV